MEEEEEEGLVPWMTVEIAAVGALASASAS